MNRLDRRNDGAGLGPGDVLAFWFEELSPEQWWNKDDALDLRITQEFGALLDSAAQAELWQWRDSAAGRLAEIIVLDQFSRNVYRNSPRAFSSDAVALALAQEAIRLGAQDALSATQRNFLYMPYMHSESARIHEEAEVLFRTNGIEESYDYELQHQAIILRFGRYPHRNAILGRLSTAEEEEFLLQPGSSF